jgi:putative heme iron utilization protein
MDADCGALRMEGERNMATAPPDQPPPAPEPPAWAARKLLRAARSAALASVAGGQPFASLVTPACAADLSVLLLLSSLSEHTRHLRADGRCSLLVVGAPEGANPQTAPRLTLTGTAEIDTDPALKARWLAVHPYGALYADFADFAIWRIRPAQALFVAGFARATRLRQADLASDPAAVAAIANAATDIMTHCNRDHPDAMVAITCHAISGSQRGPWQMIGVDVDGCDLSDGELVVRVAWSAPVADPGELRAELLRLVRAAG